MPTFESSTLLTIGLALRRAADHDLPVRVLVTGHWLEGHVRGYGSEGAALQVGQVTSVLRLASIDAVVIDQSTAGVPQLDERDSANAEVNRIAAERQAREQGAA